MYLTAFLFRGILVLSMVYLVYGEKITEGDNNIPNETNMKNKEYLRDFEMEDKSYRTNLIMDAILHANDMEITDNISKHTRTVMVEDETKIRRPKELNTLSPKKFMAKHMYSKNVKNKYTGTYEEENSIHNNHGDIKNILKGRESMHERSHKLIQNRTSVAGDAQMLHQNSASLIRGCKEPRSNVKPMLISSQMLMQNRKSPFTAIQILKPFSKSVNKSNRVKRTSLSISANKSYGTKRASSLNLFRGSKTSAENSLTDSLSSQTIKSMLSSYIHYLLSGSLKRNNLKSGIFGKDDRIYIEPKIAGKKFPFYTTAKVWTPKIQCSGTLISPWHVLTAGHCLHDGKVRHNS